MRGGLRYRLCLVMYLTIAETRTVAPMGAKGLSGECEGWYQVGLGEMVLFTVVMLTSRVARGEVGVDVNKIPLVPAVVVVGHIGFLHRIFVVEAGGRGHAQEGSTVVKWEMVQMGRI